MNAPARGYSWDPFAAGNAAAVKSGAWSPALIEQTMTELRPDLAAIIEDAPWILPIDRHGLEDYLHDRARLARLERWLAENGDRYPEGHKRAGELRSRDLAEIGSLRRRCMDARRALGLDPASRARMRFGSRALDLAHELAVLDVEEADADHA